MEKKKIVLFDMDGTLTEPRKKMNRLMCDSLIKLQKNGFIIGIVSGSDFDYILEQCQIIFDINLLNYQIIDFYPCNGTKHYRLKNNCEKIN